MRQLCAARLIAGIDTASKAPGPALVAPAPGLLLTILYLLQLPCTAHKTMFCCSVQDASLSIGVLSQMKRCSHCRGLQQEKPVQKPTRQMATHRVPVVIAQMTPSWLTSFATLQICRTLTYCALA